MKTPVLVARRLVAGFLIAGLLTAYGGFAQCPNTATLISSGNCVGTPLSVSTAATLSQILWKQNGNTVLTVSATATGRTGITVAGSPGDHGSLSDQLNNPIGLWLDAAGNIYIVDRLNYRIQKWAPGASNGSTVAGGNGQGVGANQLSDPIGVFVDPAGNVFVDDYGNNRIQEWAPAATAGVTVAGGNGQGSAPNQLFDPIGVFADALGNIYIGDAGNNRVQKWAPGAASGVTVAGGNGAGSSPNQLNFPAGIFLDSATNIYIADEKNNRVQEWAPGATSGVTVAGGNGTGLGLNQLNTPYGVFVDRAGNVYVDDQVNARIEEWAPGATSGKTVAGGNGGGAGANQLFQPTGVFVDANGVIYIADYGNNRIQKWATLSGISNVYIPVAPGSFTATVTDNSGCVSTTNAIIVNPTTTPSITITASDTNICAGAPVSFLASDSNGGSSPNFQWLLNGTPVGGNSNGYTNPAPADGDVVICSMASNILCPRPAIVSSDPIPIHVSPNTPLSVGIATPATTICSGEPARFVATPSAGTAVPDYHWQVNGTAVGADSSGFTSNSLANGDIITCILTSSASCLTAVSPPITLTVNPSPQIGPGSTISLSRGQSVPLDPTITGDIAAYLWSPAGGLSNDTIPNPIAMPLISIDYTLQVVATDGCKASGNFAVKVSSPLRIPSAFTPNGDGRNDIFYVLGGPEGSRIRDLSVFGRSGQKVFQVHDAPPGDPGFGWNGTIRGAKAQTGAYIYVAVITLADGTQQVFKGTIMLIR